MKQQNWIYSDNQGHKHYIGLMHGVESGNLMIHCNSKVIVIDFQVLTDKTYSFLLNKNLCKISIFKEDSNYYYEFDVEEQEDEKVEHVDTPQKAIKKGVDWQKLAIIGSFIGFFSLILVIAVLINRNITPTYVPRTSVAKVYVDHKHPFQLVYQFTDQNNNLIEDFVNLSSSNYLDETIFPVEDGDEFIVRYSYNNPKDNILIFSQPTPTTIDLYKRRALEVHKKNNYDIPNGILRCQIDQIFTYNGLSGLASVYYQNSSETKDFPFNQNTFNNLIKDPFLKELIEKNCN